MSRPGFEEIYMRLALNLADRSTCSRLQVGTVITSTDFRNVLAIGYNGNATGFTNGCDRSTPGKCGCLHAEDNAVINCASPSYVDKFVFITHVSCEMCAKRLVNLGGVKRVYCQQDYSTNSGLTVFEKADIPITRTTHNIGITLTYT